MEQKSISTEEAKKSFVYELFKSLSSNEKGLADAQAEERIKQYGYNEITGKKKNPIIKFLSYFWGPIPWMIEVAAILSAIINHWEDFWIIKPGAVLLWSAIVTKLLATLVAVYGWFISPIGWDLALFVWGFALVAFIITDFLKVQMYKVFDNTGIIFKRI